MTLNVCLAQEGAVVYITFGTPVMFVWQHWKQEANNKLTNW
jgi:hypothetical protein